MRNILLFLIISYFGFISNQDSTNIYYDVTKDSFNKKYENLLKENAYCFIFSPSENNDVYFTLRTNRAIYGNITVYEFEKSGTNYIKNKVYLVFKTSGYKIINNEYLLSYKIIRISKPTNYLGIEIRSNYNLDYLKLSISGDNNKDINYNEYSTRTLYPLIQFLFWIDITQNAFEELKIFISMKYTNYLPFETFNIVEHSSRNAASEPTIQKAKLIKNGDLYEYSFNYEVNHPSYMKFLSFDFLSNYEIEDFKIKVQRSSDIMEQIYYNVTKDNFNNTYFNLKKEYLHNFVFPSEYYKDIYCSLRTRLTYSGILKNIYIYNYDIYNLTNKNGDRIGAAKYRYQSINLEYALEYIATFKTTLSSKNYKYIGIAIYLNYNIDYLKINIVSDNKIYLNNYELNTRNIFPLIPYIYFIEITSSTYELRGNIHTNLLKDQPFETFNIKEYIDDNENNYLISTDEVAKFKKTFRYDLYISYEIQKSPHIKYISFNFTSYYELELFQIKIRPNIYGEPDKDIYYDVTTTNYFNEQFTNLNKKNIYIFVVPVKSLIYVYFSLRTNYSNINIFESLDTLIFLKYPEAKFMYDELESFPIKDIKINNELVVYFNTHTHTTYSSGHHLGLRMKLNNDLDSMILSITNYPFFKIPYNTYITKNFIPFLPYKFMVERKEFYTYVITVSVKYIPNIPFDTFIVEEYIDEDFSFRDAEIKVDLIKNGGLYQFSFSYNLSDTKLTKFISFDFVSNYTLNDFTIKVIDPYNIDSETKILGHSILNFSLIAGGAFLIIVIIIIIIVVKKRKKKNSEDQITETSEQPLFPDSNK